MMWSRVGALPFDVIACLEPAIQGQESQPFLSVALDARACPGHDEEECGHGTRAGPMAGARKAKERAG